MAPSASYRVTCATAIVVALHLALAAVVLTRHDRIPVVAPESHVITAELLQSAPAPAPVAAAAVIQSTPTPPTPPVTRVKPKERNEPKPKPVPAPVPVAPDRSNQQVHTPTAAAEPAGPVAPAEPTGPAGPVAQASGTPQPGKAVMALNAPKNVSHLDCRIVTPDYPNRSKRSGETGTAYVRFVVGLTGQIENVELKKSSGFDRLDAAALDAMRASSCEPYLENGAPVRAAYTQPFNFALGG
jgi:periplasmic protein TonB